MSITTIATMANKHSDFIQYQYMTLKKFIKHSFNYIVFDTSIDRLPTKECERLGIECHRIEPINRDPSINVAHNLTLLWKDYVHFYKGPFFLLDNDMFITKDISIEKIVSEYDISYVPQEPMGYMWTGILIFNMDTISKDIDFSICSLPNGRSDVGGKTYYFLREREYKKLLIHFYTLEDFTGDRYLLSMDGRFKLGDSDLHKFEPHLKIIKKYDFPNPYSFDLLTMNNGDEYFGLHYKSAGWVDYGKAYENKKKQGLKNMITDIVEGEKNEIGNILSNI